MSICNVWLGQDLAIIATDTVGIGRPSGLPSPFSKVMTVPHTRTVFACRGERMSFQILLNEVAAGEHKLESFDDVAAAMPAIIERVREISARMFKPPGVDVTLQVIAVGWSDRLEGMAGAHAVFYPDEEAFHQGPEDFGGLFVPLPEDEVQEVAALPGKPGFDMARDIHELMARQVTHGRLENPDTGFGGDLIVAIVSRDETIFRNLGPIED